jgi:hypothetical protein
VYYKNIQIDLDAINRDDFTVAEREVNGIETFLIVPKKSKHIWTPDELILRSLLVDAYGTVLSSGFPKFFNEGENKEDTRALYAALAAGTVELTEKRDGSLLIADVINDAPNLRTRGSHNLGVFEAPVMALIEEKYPRFLETMRVWPSPFKRYSLLFEYTAPDNQIVIRYQEPELRLLAVVDKSKLRVEFDRDFLNMVSEAVGVPVVKTFPLNAKIPVDLSFFRNTTDIEGTVARFYLDGKPKFVKVKSAHYVRLHSLRFRLSGSERKLAFLLDITSEDEIFPKLAEIGIDFEGAEFVRPEIEKYLVQMENTWTQYTRLASRVKKWKQLSEDSDPRAQKKLFVEIARQQIAEDFNDEKHIFSAAMSLYNGNHAEAWIQFVAAEILYESAMTVRKWAEDSKGVVASMLSAPAYDDE